MVTVKANDGSLHLSSFNFGSMRDEPAQDTESDYYLILATIEDVYEFDGSGFKYDKHDNPVDGVITGFQKSLWYDDFHNRIMEVSYEGLHIEAATFVKIANSESANDDDALMRSALSGNDKIVGGKYEDTAYGYAGNDTIQGRADDDVIDGGAGKDRIDGGTGDDYLRGSSGADIFIFSTRYGHDEIRDFRAIGNNRDVVDLSGLKGVNDFADLKANHLTVDGADLTIASGKDTLTLHHVAKSDLSADDFLF